jgi:3-oxoacyl-[acyl-carrier protein] reductase
MASENYPTYADLANKVAVVTGGSRGIGAVTCRLLAENGAKVTVGGRDEAAINSVIQEIRGGGGEAIGVAADLTDFAAVERMRRRIEEELGPAEVLAAFAGGQGYPTPTEQMAEEQWRSVIDSDLTATFLTVRTFLPGMIERGRGSIVTMASSAGRLPSQASAAYAAAKAGVVMFSRHLANEVGQHGVRVNCLAPSSVLTERVKRLMPEETQRQVAAMHR